MSSKERISMLEEELNEITLSINEQKIFHSKLAG
jgi:hypothetical protein